jgi:DUF2075 family protein/SOS-response transcriptional repressor LexA
VDLRDAILERNLANNKSRMVAGYCWDWKSKTNPNAMDIVIEGTGFEAKWNLSNSGTPWIIGKDSVREVGCIHTCQGLELDYVGVIVGPDLIARSGQLETDGFKRSTMDQSLKGFKSLFKSNPAEATQKADAIIRNTYRTLMSRGLKGCFICCTDKETNDYFRSAASAVLEEPSLEERYPGLHLKIVASNETPRPANVVPVYDLSIAAGDFSQYQSVEEFDYVELPEPFTAKPNYFVARVMGESMNRRIPNGSWCLFKQEPGGTREGKIVLVQHREIQDVDNGGQFTIKRYHSEKSFNDAQAWKHSRIVLKPESYLPTYKSLVFENGEIAEVKVIGEFVAIVV